MSDYICPDCNGPLGYTPTVPEQVCKKCFDEWDGMTIDELFGVSEEPTEEGTKDSQPCDEEGRYAELEQKHFGDPEKETGIYAPKKHD